MELNAIWNNVCVIHEYTKRLTILGEEFGKDFLGFYQPLNELKNAYEHIIRAKSQELGLRVLKTETDLTEKEYVLSNIRKAMAHEYRAFFDTADYLSVVVRDKIIKILIPYSPIVISTAIPEYYKEYRSRIDEITYDIAEYRGMKDIGKIEITLPTVEKYANACEELINIYRSINKKMNVLLEVKEGLHQEKEAERKRELKVKIAIAATCLIIGVSITLLIKMFV
jgi:hypothetical protein